MKGNGINNAYIKILRMMSFSRAETRMLFTPTTLPNRHDKVSKNGKEHATEWFANWKIHTVYPSLLPEQFQEM